MTKFHKFEEILGGSRQNFSIKNHTCLSNY